MLQHVGRCTGSMLHDAVGRFTESMPQVDVGLWGFMFIIHRLKKILKYTL